MQQKREEVIEFLVSNGGKEDCGYTWQEIAEIHGLPTDSKTLKRLSDWWRYFQRKSDSMDLKEEGPGIPGLEIKSAWQSPSGKWLYSFRSTQGLDVEEFRKELIDEMSNFSPNKLPKFKAFGDKRTIMYEINLPDLHFGNEPTDKLLDRFDKTVNDLTARIPPLNKVERILLPIGNDLLNTDHNYTTTRGTPQFDYVEWRESFQLGWKTMVNLITYLSAMAPVDVVVVQGNHDFRRTFYLGDVIDAWFRNDADVTVDNSFSSRKYYSYGKNLIMFEHGQNIKPQDFPLIMATEKPVEFANSRFREVHCGHLHHEILKEYRGVKVRFLPALCNLDEWHKKNGYSQNRIGQAFMWHKEDGLIGINQIDHGPDNKS